MIVTYIRNSRYLYLREKKNKNGQMEFDYNRALEMLKETAKNRKEKKPNES